MLFGLRAVLPIYRVQFLVQRLQFLVRSFELLACISRPHFRLAHLVLDSPRDAFHRFVTDRLNGFTFVGFGTVAPASRIPDLFVSLHSVESAHTAIRGW